MRTYQGPWHEQRKREYLQYRSCECCGSKERLRIGSKRPQSLRELAGGTNPWSLSAERFDELMEAHGTVRCLSCHNKKAARVRFINEHLPNILEQIKGVRDDAGSESGRGGEGDREPQSGAHGDPQQGGQ